MPFGGLGSLLSLGAAGLSVGSGLAGLFGGSPASQVQMPQTYQYGNLSGADAGAYGGTQGLGAYNVAAQNLPQYQSLVQQGVNNPYAGGYQQGANATGAAQFGAGANIAGSSLSQLPNVQALIQMGFDPQQALYQQLQNQNQQQSLATLGQSGVAGTPYGQGVNNQNNTNFNLGWENQALQRASTAEQGAGSLLSSITGNTGAGLGMMQQGAGLPYNTFQGINANALGTLSGAGQYGQQASTIPQTQISDYLAYLSGGTGQQGVNNQTGQLGLNQANMAFQQNQQFGNQIGGGLAGLAKGWGGTSGNTFYPGQTGTQQIGNYTMPQF